MTSIDLQVEGAEALDDLEGRGHTVERAITAIRGLILSQDLFPGQQLRQVDLSDRIGVSRGPTREALQALSKEGLITHSRNRGYTVARFSFSEMEQLYKLRDLAETEILKSISAPSDEQIAHLRELNEQIRDPETSREDAMTLNKDFHFAIFALSPKQLIVTEIDRWWRMTTAYRTLGIGVFPERGAMMAAEHDAQIEALVALDRERLVELARGHRNFSLKQIQSLLR
jgi:DNA-binding GntR family transcriptional regulator